MPYAHISYAREDVRSGLVEGTPEGAKGRRPAERYTAAIIMLARATAQAYDPAASKK